MWLRGGGQERGTVEEIEQKGWRNFVFQLTKRGYLEGIKLAKDEQYEDFTRMKLGSFHADDIKN